MYNLILKIYMQVKLRLAYIVQVPGIFYELEPNKRLRPNPDAAPLMCRT